MMSNECVTGIVDCNHEGGWPDLGVAVRDGGLLAVLHKATEGVGWRDPHFAVVANNARDLGLSVGAYHFGTGAHAGEDQARELVAALDLVDRDEVLPMLDFERRQRGPSMDLAQACAFVTTIHAELGRWPLFYGGLDNLRHTMRAATEAQRALLGRCALMLAVYGADPLGVVPPPPWGAWDLLQYTDGTFGPPDREKWPRRMPGFSNADRSAFRGTAADLAYWWATTGREVGP